MFCIVESRRWGSKYFPEKVLCWGRHFSKKKIIYYVIKNILLNFLSTNEPL